jgi:hypothetical protein
MKRSFFFLSLIFIFAVNNFSQTKTPFEIASEFCNLALKNDFEAAKEQINAKSFSGIKLESLKIDFQTVSKKGFKKLDVVFQQTLPATAKFIFSSEGSYEKVVFEVSLVKFVTDWKINSFDTKISWNFRVYEYGNYSPSLPDFNKFNPPLVNSYAPQYSPFAPPIKPKEPKIIAEPYYPNKNPAKYQAEPYNPSKNPVYSLDITPKNP